MDIALIIIAFLLLATGIAGAVIPGLPGPPIGWAGLLLAFLSPLAEISTPMLIVTAVLAAAITVLDYVIPSLATKRFKGSKYGVWGCNIGLVISLLGLPFGPGGLLGIVFWPFIGAFVGEYINSRDTHDSLRAAFGSFLGLLTGTLLKLVYCIVLLIVVIIALF
jgi:uncharacterized protein YqgC (DUF456 family)